MDKIYLIYVKRNTWNKVFLKPLNNKKEVCYFLLNISQLWNRTQRQGMIRLKECNAIRITVLEQQLIMYSLLTVGQFISPPPLTGISAMSSPVLEDSVLFWHFNSR